MLAMFSFLIVHPVNFILYTVPSSNHSRLQNTHLCTGSSRRTGQSQPDTHSGIHRGGWCNHTGIASNLLVSTHLSRCNADQSHQPCSRVDTNSDSHQGCFHIGRLAGRYFAAHGIHQCLKIYHVWIRRSLISHSGRCLQLLSVTKKGQ